MGFYHDQVLYLLRDDKEGSPSLWVPWEPWPKAHGPPLLGGGEMQSREARGEVAGRTLGVPPVVPSSPGLGLPRKLGRTPTFPESCVVFLVNLVPILPIFTSQYS